MSNDWINQLPTWIVSNTKNIVNRSQRRKYVASYNKIIKDLLDTEEMFLKDICFAHSAISYNEIYCFHLEQFINKVKWHQDYGKHTNIVINENYFSDKFKPVITKS